MAAANELIKKYKAAPKDPIFIKGQIPLDSLVVTKAHKRANSLTTGEAPPPDKESKLIDVSGKRVASQAANSWRIANTQALLARYDRAHYDELEKLITHLPKEHQKKADQLIQEGKIITNTSIKCALDAADTAARSINTSIMLRRHAWLKISGFKQEVQTSLLNQPFDEKTLFGSGTDEALEKMKKDTETAKSMGALQQPTQRGSFRRSTYRGGSKNTGTSQQSTSFTPTSPRDKLFLRTLPSFLPKVVAPYHSKHHPAGVICSTSFSKEDEKLNYFDTKRALSFYIDRTNDHREDN
ncbi:uncharacterized protein LOC144825355 [Lissotriton helveticus]